MLLEKNNNNNNSKKTDAEESWVVKRKLKRQNTTKKGEPVEKERTKEEEGGVVLATCFGIDARKKPSNLTEHDITHVFWGPINSVRLSWPVISFSKNFHNHIGLWRGVLAQCFVGLHDGFL